MLNVETIDYNSAIEIDKSTRRKVESIATFIVTNLASARFTCALDLKASLLNVFKDKNNNLDYRLLNEATSLVKNAIEYYNTTSNTDLELTYDVNNPTFFQTNKKIPLDDVEKLVRSIAYTGDIQDSKKQFSFNRIESIQL